MEKRLPVSIVVNLAPVMRLPADETELTYTENVSDHGVCVVSNHPWQCGEVAEISSLLEQIPLRGEVVHCRKCGDERYAIGLRFRSAVVWPASVTHAVPQHSTEEALLKLRGRRELECKPVQATCTGGFAR